MNAPTPVPPAACVPPGRTAEQSRLVLAQTLFDAVVAHVGAEPAYSGVAAFSDLAPFAELADDLQVVAESALLEVVPVVLALAIEGGAS